VHPLGGSLITVALVIAVLALLYLIRYTATHVDQQQNALALYKGDLARLLKSTPLVVLLVTVVSCSIGYRNGVVINELNNVDCLRRISRESGCI
jgi:ABC-type phosphate transport system permease subunit